MLSGGLTHDAAFSPDSQRVVSAGDDGTIRVWAMGSGGQTVMLRGHQGAVYHVAFSTDGHQVVSAGDGGTVRVWTWASGGDPIVLPGHQGTVLSAAFSPDGRQVVSAGDDGTLRVWAWAKGGAPVVVSDHPPGFAATGAAFPPDGRLVVSALRTSPCGLNDARHACPSSKCSSWPEAGSPATSQPRSGLPLCRNHEQMAPLRHQFDVAVCDD
jgi:WD40 repeat protein